MYVPLYYVFMLYIKRFIVFAILFIPFYASAQSNCNLSLNGRIIDADTNLPLSNATVHLLQGNVDVQTDGHGFFNFNKLCPGDYTLRISSVGFESKAYPIKLPQDNPSVDIILEHEGVVLLDVEVVGHQAAVRSTATATTLRNRDLDESKGSVLAEILQNVAGVTMMQTGATIAKPVINGMH